MSRADINRRYYWRHRERILDNCFNAYWKDREGTLSYHKRWRRENPMKAAFAVAKGSAKRLDIEFSLTLEEFAELWGDDVGRRGRYGADLCMYRYGDIGAYERDNVYIATLSEHAAGVRA